MKKIDLIGVQMDFGAGTRGVNMGPAAIRFAGLTAGINRKLTCRFSNKD